MDSYDWRKNWSELNLRNLARLIKWRIFFRLIDWYRLRRAHLYVYTSLDEPGMVIKDPTVTECGRFRAGRNYYQRRRRIR
jgi:hypothetical protein